MTLNDESDLCQSCGLCCDGTLFSHFELKDGEAPPQCNDQLTIKPREGRRTAYLQPCSALRNATCKIYDHRPSVCRTFQCQLLKGFTRGAVSKEQAMNRIEQVKQTKAEVAKLLGAERAGALDRLRFLQVLDSKSGKRDQLQAKLAIGILEILLDQHFRDDEHRKLVERPDLMGMPRDQG